MYAIADDKEHKVHSIIQTDKELQVVVDYYPEFKPNSVLVFMHKNADEVLGLITETKDNEKHRVCYVEINPNQVSNLNIKQIESILLWGVLN